MDKEERKSVIARLSSFMTEQYMLDRSICVVEDLYKDKFSHYSDEELKVLLEEYL